jgi:hypothetical protein
MHSLGRVQDEDDGLVKLKQLLAQSGDVVPFGQGWGAQVR